MNIKKPTVLMTAVLVAAVGIAGAPLAFAQDNGDSEAASQVNDCGNGFLAINSLCQDLASQIQGDNNDVYISGEQEAKTGAVEVTVPGLGTGTQEETEEEATEEEATEEEAEDAEFE